MSKKEGSRKNGSKEKGSRADGRSSDNELPLFVKTHDFLLWLIPLTKHFPRIFRYTVTQRLINAGLDFQERILEANALRGAERLTYLQKADTELSKLRLYLRLVHRLKWLSLGQYRHGAGLLTELGKLLGTWQKGTSSQIERQSLVPRG